MNSDKCGHIYGNSNNPIINMLKIRLCDYIEGHLQNPENLRLLAGQYRIDSQPENETKDFEFYVQLEKLVQRGISEGLFRDQNVDSVVQFLWASVFGLSCLLVLRHGFPWQDDIVESSVSQMINSLLSL